MKRISVEILHLQTSFQSNYAALNYLFIINSTQNLIELKFKQINAILI